MSDHNDYLAGLIGSRICHDLASPVGAVANGLELLELAGGGGGPELTLAAQSAAAAKARLRLFRLAFGVAWIDQSVGSAEVAGVLEQCYAETRIAVVWAAEGDYPRDRVQAAILALLCVETALPRGGTVRVSEQAGAWQVRAKAAQVNWDDRLWRLLPGGDARNGVSPKEVQFLLLPLLLQQEGLNCSVQHTDTSVEIKF